MDKLTLRYAEDPSTGLPRLEDPGGRLSSDELQALGRALDRHFGRLGGEGIDGRFLELGAVGSHLPHRFRVTVVDRERRCPTLLLEAVPPSEWKEAAVAEEPLSDVLGRWQLRFLGEVAELLAGGEASATRRPLEFVLADLRALLRKDPRKFALLLFAGYLYIGDALSGEPGQNMYRKAARELARLVDGTLPEETFAPLLASSPANTSRTTEERPGWLRRFFSLS